MLIRITKSDPDALAQRLMQLGQMARAMPPAWDGAEIAHPVLSPNGGTLGRMLPGQGLYLTEDLTRLGIRRVLPGVFEYSKFRWLLDTIGNQRGAITSYDQMLTARLANLADDVTLQKTSITGGSDLWCSTYRDAGVPIGAGTYTNIPGGAAHDMTSAGAWSSLLHQPSGTDKKYLVGLGWGASSQRLQCVMLVDLLVAAGNILATTTSPQTVNSTALSRYTSGAGVLMTFEVTTSLGATAQNLTANKYTNQSGATLQTTPAVALFGAGTGQERLVPPALGPWMQLADGDYGVRSVEEVTLSAANSTGVMALNLYKPLAFLPGIDGDTFVDRDFVSQVDALIELVSVSGVLGCLTAFFMGGSTPTLRFHLRTVDG